MTHPLVDFVLTAIKDNWQAGAYADIPLERIDRDNSELLDGNIRSKKEDLQDNNYVGASHADRSATPIGTEYDDDVEQIVSVRIEGLHTSEFGKVDPNASLPPTTANDPVPWYDLHTEIRLAIQRDRTFPNTSGRADFTDLRITNETPQSDDHHDYYRHDFDVIFRGYEALP